MVPTAEDVEAGGAPGLGGGPWMSTQEYQDAVASLWQDADPQAQQVLRACGIEPPSSETTDPRKVLKRYLAEYKNITEQHRNLVSRKAQLQIKADKIKAQFEKKLFRILLMSQRT